MEDRLWTSGEVAEYLGVPLKTLYQWRAEGRGPTAYRVGRFMRYQREDVDTWLAERADSGNAREVG